MKFLIILILALLLPLAACSTRNPARVDICLAALTAVEMGDDRIVVEDVGGETASISLAYHRETAAARSNLVCTFVGSATSLGQLDLSGLTLNGVDLGPGRFTYIKRNWLTRGGDDAVKARVIRPASGFFRIGTTAGTYVQAIFSALPIASVYVLLALGFALIHGITGRMNIAHGEFATIGAYAGFAGFMVAGSSSVLYGIAGAIVFCVAAAACTGFLAIRAVFVPLARREGLMLLVASVGLIIVFEEFVRLTHASRELWLPPVLADPIALTLPPYVVTVTPMQILVSLASALLAGTVLLLLRASRFGRAWRAVADDPLAARFMGIDPAHILGVSAVLSAGLAGLAGLVVLLAYGNANHSMGLMMSVKAMLAALIGGMGSPGGAVLGALVLVAFETLWVVAFSGGTRDIAVFAMLVALLTLQPGGLFGLARGK